MYYVVLYGHYGVQSLTIQSLFTDTEQTEYHVTLLRKTPKLLGPDLTWSHVNLNLATVVLAVQTSKHHHGK